MQRVEGNRERFHQRGVGHPRAGGKRHQAARVDPHLIGQTAVDRDAVHPLHGHAAQLVLTGGTTLALAARNCGLHRHRRPVFQHSAKLVAEGDLEPERAQVQVRTANAGRLDPHDDAALRGGHVDDRHPANPISTAPDSPH